MSDELDVTIEALLSSGDNSHGVSLNPTDNESSLLNSNADEKYRLGAEIAKGGMGAVLKAKDINIRRKVAMKVMLDRTKASKEQVIRFIEEAQVTGQLEHPNIVPVHELSVDEDGNPFYTMKMIKGVTLKEIVENIRKGDKETIKQYPITRLLNIFLQACNGVSYAHSKGVIHRDLKPENIMVGEYGEVLVVDWGLAKILNKPEHLQVKINTEDWDIDDVDSLRSDDEGLSQMTMVGQAMGTPAYMAPEQAEDASGVNEKADIYSMGGVLYNLLTLRNPVVGNSLRGILLKVVQGNIIPPSKFNDSGFKLENEKSSINLVHLGHQRIPSSLTSVTMKALANKLDERYSSIADLQKDIQAYLDGFATDAEEANAWTQLKLLVKRNKVLFGGAFFAVAILTVVITVAFINVKKEQKIAEDNADKAETQRDLAVKAESELSSVSKKAAPEFYTKALRFYHLQQYELSLTNLDIAVSLDEKHFKAWELMTRVSLYQENFIKAKSAFEKSVGLVISEHSDKLSKLIDTTQQFEKKSSNELGIRIIKLCEDLNEYSLGLKYANKIDNSELARGLGLKAARENTGWLEAYISKNEIIFQCINCKGIISINQNSFGSRVNCGHCRKVVVAPSELLSLGTAIGDFLLIEELDKDSDRFAKESRYFRAKQFSLNKEVKLQCLTSKNNKMAKEFITFSRKTKSQALGQFHSVYYRAYSLSKD